MNLVDGFTYNGEIVGGPTPTHSTEVISHFMLIDTQDDAEFVVRFVVRGATYDALNSACQAIESTLRQRYAKLVINWAGASAVETFDPDVNAGTFPSSGFDQEPQLRKLTAEEFPSSGLARGYEFRVRLAQYPNYTDAFGPAAGRRQVDVSMHYDLNDRFVVSMSGEWTQVPSALARAQFLAQLDGASGYAAYRLAKINNTAGSGATGVTWCVAARDETDPNSLSTLRFSRRYEQHVNGRRSSSVEVFFDAQRLRRVTIRGTYSRTIAGTGGAFGNVYGTAASARTNFGDATNGGRAFAEAAGTGQLASLTAAQGGALTYGSDCELMLEPTVVVNEQDDRADYTLVYRELNQKQSNAATVLDDPNIIADTMAFAAVFSEVNDSTRAPLASAIPGPNGDTAGGGSPPPVSDHPGTYSAPASPDKSTGGTVAGQVVDVQKPVDLIVHYEAFFLKGIGNLFNYWTQQVEPLLIQLFSTLFGFQGVEYVNRAFRPDPTSNKVSADVHLRAYSGNVILFSFTVGKFNDTGVRVDGAFTGVPHEYLVQQALPRSNMSRKVEAVYRTGGGVASFSLDPFKSPQLYEGWVKTADAEPATTNKTLGIPQLGVPQTDLSYAVLEENFVWVKRNVGQASGGGGSPKVTTGGGQSTQPVSPAIATGVDASGNALAH